MNSKDKLAFLKNNIDVIKYKKIDIVEFIVKNKLNEKYYISDLLEIFSVKRSYWDKYKNKVSYVKNKDYKLVKLIKEIFDNSLKQYGVRRIKKELELKFSLTVNHKKIRRILNEHELLSEYVIKIKSNRAKRYDHRNYRTENPRFAKDLINRNFRKSEKPNQIWYTDVTYLISENGKRYMSTFIDDFDKRVVGYHISNMNNTKLVIESLKNSITNSCITKEECKNLIIHSDRGIQYVSNEYKAYLKFLGIKSSMGQTGVTQDNIEIERFHSELKKGTIHNNSYFKFDINSYVDFVKNEWIPWYKKEVQKRNKN